MKDPLWINTSTSKIPGIEIYFYQRHTSQEFFTGFYSVVKS